MRPLPRRPLLAMLGLGLGATAWLAWRMFEPLGRDQAVFYVLGRELWAGALPYRDLFEHKPPGVLLIYALAALLDGGDGWAIGLLDSAAAGATAALLFAVLDTAGNRSAAWWTALLYVLCARAPCFGGWWATGQPEAFQDLCVAGAILAGQRRAWSLAGTWIFWALLLKFTYFGLVPVWLYWAGRAGAPRLCAGLALPALACAGLAGLSATAEPAWRAVVAFNLRHAQVQAVSWQRLPLLLGKGALSLASGVPAVTLAVAAGLVVPALRRLPRSRHPLALPAWLPAGVLAAATLQLMVQRKLWLWHWNPLVLGLVLLAGLMWTQWAERSRRWTVLVALIALTPTLSQTLCDVRRRFDPGSRIDVLSRYTWGRRHHDFSAFEVAAVGTAVAQMAQREDRLFVWGFEPGVYLTSGLRPGTAWIYDYPLTVGLDPAQRATAIAAIVTALPRIRWWVVFDHDQNALEPLDSREELRQIPLLHEAWQRDYHSVGRVGDAELFERNSR